MKIYTDGQEFDLAVNRYIERLCDAGFTCLPNRDKTVWRLSGQNNTTLYKYEVSIE